MAKILVVDDELKITRLVRDYLHQAGFAVVEASDGEGALRAARAHDLDLIVLDLGLPGMDGLDVTRKLRQSSAVPIIMLTARADESDRIVGLELGADDYVVKPFSPKELVARIRAVLRRVGVQETGDEIVESGGIRIDLGRRTVTADGSRVELTPTEFDLLAAMASQPGRVFTRAQLLDVIHGIAIDSYERAIDTHIKNLRRKIESDSAQPRHVLTVHGVGYKIADG